MGHRVTRREARAASRTIRAGYPLPPEELDRLAAIVVARSQRQQSFDRWYRRVFLGFVAAGSAVVLVFMILALPANISAALGHGVHGTYMPQTLVPVGRSGTAWSGTFISDSDQVETNVTYFDRLPSGADAGSSFPALYRDRQAYPLHGSHVWVANILLLVLSAGVLIALVWLGPFRALARRRRAQHDGTSSAIGRPTTRALRRPGSRMR